MDLDHEDILTITDPLGVTMKLLTKSFKSKITVLLSVVFLLLAACMLPVSVAHAAETDNPNNATLISHSGDRDDHQAWDEYSLSDGTVVRFSYNRDSGVISVYRDGKLTDTLTDQEILQEVNDQVKPSNPDIDLENACGNVMFGLGLVNSALWTAAGLTAWCPAASAAAGIGGFVTGAVISAGSLAC